MPTNCKDDYGAHQGKRARKRYVVILIDMGSRKPPASVADLAQMLEIELKLGLRQDFMNRLQRALNSVARAYAENLPLSRGRSTLPLSRLSPRDQKVLP